MEDEVLAFQEKLIQVQDFLSQSEVQELVFLCSDLLEKDLSSVGSATDLFLLLQNNDHLSAEDTSLLVELLSIIKRHGLIKKLQLDKQLPGNRISLYRKLLFELAEQISEEDLKRIKFLLFKHLPRRIFKSDMTMLQLLMEMEKKALLNAENLNILERIIEKTCPLLKRNIDQYKKRSGVAVQKNVDLDFLDLSVATKPVQTLEQYVMNGDWRGHCLIINNYDFSAYPKLKNRKGTDTDEKSLKAIFQWLGFQINTVRDCSRENMLKAMDDLRTQDHSKADCVVCCVLSHGYDGGVFGVDGNKVAVKELTEPLFGHNCRSLSQKPKLFFIQACQGKNEHPADFLQSDSSKDSSESGIVCDAVPFIESIPAGADFLISMATLSQYVSFRDTKMGTWFIQSLCENLQKLVPSGNDLLSILTEVNRDVSQKNADIKGNRKQMPKPEYTLRKKVVFPVPKNCPPLLLN
ncbi:caspase-8 [Trichomycterus rosablanca]|uniref:caspase-8 n=1 Tax=Trichomycterus rosablanca TaxID=2290929 RepID=UPI002F35DE6B